MGLLSNKMWGISHNLQYNFALKIVKNCRMREILHILLLYNLHTERKSDETPSLNERQGQPCLCPQCRPLRRAGKCSLACMGDFFSSICVFDQLKKCTCVSSYGKSKTWWDSGHMPITLPWRSLLRSFTVTGIFIPQDAVNNIESNPPDEFVKPHLISQ